MPDVINVFFHFFVGVPIFFMLSGYLIWQSVGRSDNYPNYLKKRFWRIYPELWVSVAIEIVAIIVLYQQPIDYYKLALFAIGQATIFQFWTPDFLRGYGCGCPNGALWTICVLIQFYMIAYPLYKWLQGKSASRWVISIIVSLCISLLTPFCTGMDGRDWRETLERYFNTLFMDVSAFCLLLRKERIANTFF